MPKRKLELEFLQWKIKKLKRKLRKRSRRDASPAASSGAASEDSEENSSLDQAAVVTDSPLDIQFEETPQTNTDTVEDHPQTINKGDITPQTLDPEINLEPDPAVPKNLDPDVLDILGSNPSANTKYGADIQQDLAIRLEHIATQGLNKDSLKEITERHPIPGNCTLIGAPMLNAEIKAAIADNVIKRDKGIENRQHQLATAIAGLSRFLSKELEDNGNKENLKHLMDICRILCNIQHAESITRRNLNAFYLNKDIKEHLYNAKIDKYLFGENLTETIRSAKAVTKSGTELKAKTQTKPRVLAPSNNLNWKSPAPARKQQGPQRGREAAHPSAPGPSTRYNPGVRHGSSSKPSRRPQKPNRRR